ncbi:hypothetical protein FQN57_000068 [Myotisia sp. PD_48]|nr:hypothetical protein FQN57_000068 [Myotisia sp. PD_48]
MPATVADPPSVSLSFANNFWGKDDAGVGPMLERLQNAKTTCDELKSFYGTRAAIEDEYARKLMALCRKPLGSCEAGTLRASLDSVRGETEAIAKTHSAIAAQMKSELEEPLAAFAGGMKERRKIVQNGIEKLLKTKIQQTIAVNKSRDRYEQDCLRIKGYLAQGHMVMGQEERKNKAKLEKTQIQMASNSSEYEAAVKILEETTGRWNKEWKAACDKFQDLEEERLDFAKSSLWNYANIASTGCVSDDSSCEKIRVSLENCEVEKDITAFIKEKATGQEIPDPPRYINFCRGDLNDTSSETSEEESYSVAQFQRTINPAYRTSSPQPSTYESHHDPQSELALRMSQQHVAATPSSRETTVTPSKIATAHSNNSRRDLNMPPNYQPSQHGDIPAIPHNEYPADGMTMFCRTGPPSERGSALSSNRPSSRDSQTSIPTSFSSVEPPIVKQSMVKPAAPSVVQPEAPPAKQVQKRKSAFFSNSPFRRKSKHEKERQSEQASAPATGQSRNTWAVPSKQSRPPTGVSPTKSSVSIGRQTSSPEPVDPRANFQLNVGNNVFDVASPDASRNAKNANKNQDDLDPIAQALADLKGIGKQASVRMSADRYHGIATPAPPNNTNINAAQRGTPPPSYNDAPVKRLDAPTPAFTSAQMQKTTRKYVGQTQSMFNKSNHSVERMNTRDKAMPRATSPVPAIRRSASPQPMSNNSVRSSQVGPLHKPSNSASYQSGSMSSRYRQSPSTTPTKTVREQSYSPHYSRHNSPNEIRRSASPQPQFRRQDRPASASGMELQLSNTNQNQLTHHNGMQSDGYGSARAEPRRPQSMYYSPQEAMEIQGRVRSRSIATVDSGRPMSRDGRPVMHFARAMYSYTAAIPEELGFTKGDILAVLRHQDDGWWEAEMTNQPSRPGLVPSNYLQNC